MWTGVAHAGDAGDRYVEHLEQSVMPALRQLAGYRGAQLLRRRQPCGDIFVVTTYWDSVDAIRAFAGPDVEAAVVAPEARRVLASFADRAAHYDVTRYAGPDQPA